MKLYDRDKDKFPLERGKAFRTMQIQQCSYCTAKTNIIHVGGYPGMGLRYVCPGGNYQEHEQIKKFLKNRNWLEQKIAAFEKVDNDTIEEAHLTTTIRKTIDEYKKEVASIQFYLLHLQSLFVGHCTDIVGVDPNTKTDIFNPTLTIPLESHSIYDVTPQ